MLLVWAVTKGLSLWYFFIVAVVVEYLHTECSSALMFRKKLIECFTALELEFLLVYLWMVGLNLVSPAHSNAVLFGVFFCRVCTSSNTLQAKVTCTLSRVLNLFCLSRITKRIENSIIGIKSWKYTLCNQTSKYYTEIMIH